LPAHYAHRLAYVVTLHVDSFRPAPFFVLDEIDAALDNVNVKKVCNYISQRCTELQCLVISLKDIFFEHAHSLVGIAKDVPRYSSAIIILNRSDC
jgi:structural maintenance of chromosome 1